MFVAGLGPSTHERVGGAWDQGYGLCQQLQLAGGGWGQHRDSEHTGRRLSRALCLHLTQLTSSLAACIPLCSPSPKPHTPDCSAASAAHPASTTQPDPVACLNSPSQQQQQQHCQYQGPDSVPNTPPCHQHPTPSSPPRNISPLLAPPCTSLWCGTESLTPSTPTCSSQTAVCGRAPDYMSDRPSPPAAPPGTHQAPLAITSPQPNVGRPAHTRPRRHDCMRATRPKSPAAAVLCLARCAAAAAVRTWMTCSASTGASWRSG